LRITHTHTQTTNFLTIFLFEDLSGRKNLSIPGAAGSSPSIPLLVFWPRAGPFGTSAIRSPCAQLLWCELYDMKESQTYKNKNKSFRYRRGMVFLLRCILRAAARPALFGSGGTVFVPSLCSDGGRRRPGAPGRVPGRTTLGRTGGRSPGTCGERASGGRSRMESASMLYQGSSQATRARPAQHRRGAPAHGPRTGETPPPKKNHPPTCSVSENREFTRGKPCIHMNGGS